MIERIARAVLYEGYVLYPYRPSSLKNRRRIAFGTLGPGGRIEFRTECLLEGDDATRVTVTARFLQDRDEAVEREAATSGTIAELAAGRVERFAFDEIAGEVEARTVAAAPGVCRVTVAVRNLGSAPMVAAHAALSAEGGAFVSMTDPPERLAAAASKCRNEGVWPVLVGTPGARDTVLASPIILPDYPEVAPESAGDLYDATEIEEILTLRVLTLTDEEKAEVRASESRARAILERAEALPAEHLMRLHGTIRGLGPEAWDKWANSAPPETVEAGGVAVRTGDRVRLRPRGRADIWDSALDGRIGVVVGIEQDLEGRVLVAVVAEDDPGRDLGEMRQIGHRFFFSAAEIEPLEAGRTND